MIKRPGFSTVYAEQLVPALQELEQPRLKLKNKLRYCNVFVVTGIILFFLFCFIIPHPWYYFLSTLTCFGISGYYFKSFQDSKKAYIVGYKQKVISEIIRFINPELTYLPGEKVPERFYDKSDLYPEGYDVYLGDDYVEGKLGKTSVCFSELNVLRRRAEIENADMTLLFGGLFFVADFNKNFSARTYAWDRGERAFNFLNKENFPFAAGLEKVLLESPDFNYRFVVYSNDQVEARYILTPSLMERMTKLADSWERRISFSFVDSKIFLAIPMKKDLFEPGVSNPPAEKDIAWYYELLRMLTDIVEELNLNQRIWNKN